MQHRLLTCWPTHHSSVWLYASRYMDDSYLLWHKVTYIFQLSSSEETNETLSITWCCFYNIFNFFFALQVRIEYLKLKFSIPKSGYITGTYGYTSNHRPRLQLTAPKSLSQRAGPNPPHQRIDWIHTLHTILLNRTQPVLNKPSPTPPPRLFTPHTNLVSPTW
jgi:hypothetical protein